MPRTARPKRKQQAIWTAKDIAFAVISGVMVLAVALIAANWIWKAIPKADPVKLLVNKWLKENLQDGKWDEVKWFPPQSPQGLYDLNFLHLVQGIEKAKEQYEKGLGEDNRIACEKLHKNLRETGLRTFCAMSFRTTTLNGQAKILQRQVFEIVDGSAKPVGADNTIVELQSMPSSGGRFQTGAGYDGWRFFEDNEYDPFSVAVPKDLEERFQAAMIWKEPEKKETPPPVPVAVIVPATNQNTVANETVVANETAEEIASVRIPAKIRKYFDRVEEAKSAEIKVIKKRISEFESALRRGVTQPQVVQKKIRQHEDEIAQIKRSKGAASLSDKPEVGDVGSFRFLKVVKVVDDETLLVRCSTNAKGRSAQTDVAIHPIEAKEIEVGDESIGADVYKVMETTDEPSDVLKNLHDVGIAAELVAEPIEKSDLEKWRVQYEKENKGK